MAISEQRKRELQDLIAAHKASLSTPASPAAPAGISAERKAQLDQLIAANPATGSTRVQPVSLPDTVVNTVQDAGKSFIQKETDRLGALAGAAGDVLAGRIPVNQVGNIIKGQIAGVVGDLAGEFVSGVGSIWFKQQPKETQDSINASIQGVVNNSIPGTDLTVKDAVAKLVTTYNAWAQKHPDQAIQAGSVANILSLVPLEGIGEAVSSGARRIAAETIIASGGTAKYIPSSLGGSIVEGSLATGATRAAETGKGVLGELASSAKRTIDAIPGRIEANRAAMEASRKFLEPLPQLERDAITNGVIPRDVALSRELSLSEKALARTMISHAEQFGINRAAQDPAEIVGSEVTRRIDALDKTEIGQGEQLRELTSVFPKTPLTESVLPSVIKRLQTVPGLKGIVVNPDGTIDFSRTTLASKLSISEQRTVTSAIKDILGMDAYQLHLYRQQLFDVLDGKGKAGLVLNGTEPKSLNAIRQGIADVLDLLVPGYKKLNQQNAELLGLLANYKKYFKGLDLAPMDIRDARGAVLARRLTSNAPSSQDLSSLFSLTESVLSKYGFNFDTNINNLQDVLNAIERYFDITKDTGLAGQIKVGEADMGSSIQSAFINKAKEFAGQTKAVTQDAFKRLFEDVGGLPSSGDAKPNNPVDAVPNNAKPNKITHIQETIPQVDINSVDSLAAGVETVGNEEVKVFRGSNKGVESSTLDLRGKKVLVIPNDQRGLIADLAAKGDKEAQRIIDNFSYVDADKFILKKYGNSDFIRIDNKQLPAKGVEYFDTKTGKFYADNESTAAVYSMQNRGGKYEKGLTSVQDVKKSHGE